MDITLEHKMIAFVIVGPSVYLEGEDVEDYRTATLVPECKSALTVLGLRGGR